MKMRMVSTCVALGIIFLTACSSSTQVVEQWADTEFNGKLKNLLVISLNESADSRKVFENGFLLELSNRKIQAKVSYKLLPDYESLDKETVKAAIAGSSIDGVIVLRPVKVTKEDRHVQAQSAGTRYDEFYAYVGDYRPTYDSYTTQDTVVHLETNLYDAKTEKLVWSGQKKVTSETSEKKNVKNVIKAIVKNLEKQGMIADAAPAN